MSKKLGFEGWLERSQKNEATTTPSPASSANLSPASLFKKHAKKTETRRKLRHLSRKHVEKQNELKYEPNPFIKPKKNRTQRKRPSSSPSQTWRSVSSQEARELNMNGGKRGKGSKRSVK
jgi:hypothetical protein